MKPKKRLWEMKPSTICKILGTAFDTKDVLKLARKFKMTNSNTLVEDELAFHSALVEYAQTDNPVSRHTEKVLRKRYEPYANKLADMSPPEILKSLRETPEWVRTPLWAALWAAASSEEGEKFEAALFGYVHILEHRLVRQHWKELSIREKREGTSKQTHEESLKLRKHLLESRREIETLRKANLRLEQKMLSSASLSLFSSVSDAAPPRLPCGCVCKNKKKIVELKQMLEEERSRSRAFQSEIELFRNEVEGLMAELAKLSQVHQKSECAHTDSACPISNFLDGMSVAMVGGIESLEKHYRQLIESMGGRFHRHDGYCRGGNDALEEFISQANLVVCPIEVNSHNAARFAKKICKTKGIPCCFVKSASLATLKRTVVDSVQKVSAA